MAPRGYGAKVAMSQALAGADEAAKWFVCPQTSAASDEWDELQDAVRMDAGGWLVLTGITSARVAASRLHWLETPYILSRRKCFIIPALAPMITAGS